LLGKNGSRDTLGFATFSAREPSYTFTKAVGLDPAGSVC
jgi:hypothetical protein